MSGTAFQKKVWDEIDKIPRGEVTTYGQIAKSIGRPKAARAVANACGTNPNPIPRNRLSPWMVQILPSKMPQT